MERRLRGKGRATLEEGQVTEVTIPAGQDERETFHLEPVREIRLPVVVSLRVCRVDQLDAQSRLILPDAVAAADIQVDIHGTGRGQLASGGQCGRTVEGDLDLGGPAQVGR